MLSIFSLIQLLSYVCIVNAQYNKSHRFGKKPACPNPLIRKEWRECNEDEKKAYISHSFKCRVPGGACQELARIHFQFKTPVHNSAVFLPWHRAFLVIHEEELQKTKPGMGQPYWNSAIDSQQPFFSPVLRDLGGNPKGGCVEIPGHGKYLIQNSGIGAPPNQCLTRNFVAYAFSSTSDINDLINSHSTYGGFASQVEGLVHGVPHMFVGGEMAGMASPNDPIFYLHHAFVDKVWADWQIKNSHIANQYQPSTRGGPRGVALIDAIPHFTSYQIGDVMNLGSLCYSYINRPANVVSTLPPVAIKPPPNFVNNVAAVTNSMTTLTTQTTQQIANTQQVQMVRFYSPLFSKFKRRSLESAKVPLPAENKYATGTGTAPGKAPSGNAPAWNVTAPGNATAVVREAMQVAKAVNITTAPSVIAATTLAAAAAQSLRANVSITPPVIVPVNSANMNVTTLPANISTVADTSIRLTKLRTVSMLSDEWLKINGLDKQEFEAHRKHYANVTENLNCIPGYVGPESLWNNEELLLNAIKGGKQVFSVTINGTLITCACDTKNNHAKCAAEIKEKIKASCLSDLVQKPVAEVAEKLMKVIGPPVLPANAASNPFAPRRENEMGFGKEDHLKKGENAKAVLKEAIEKKKEQGLVVRAVAPGGASTAKLAEQVKAKVETIKQNFEVIGSKAAKGDIKAISAVNTAAATAVVKAIAVSVNTTINVTAGTNATMNVTALKTTLVKLEKKVEVKIVKDKEEKKNAPTAATGKEDNKGTGNAKKQYR